MSRKSEAMKKPTSRTNGRQSSTSPDWEKRHTAPTITSCRQPRKPRGRQLGSRAEGRG